MCVALSHLFSKRGSHSHIDLCIEKTLQGHKGDWQPDGLPLREGLGTDEIVMFISRPEPSSRLSANITYSVSILNCMTTVSAMRPLSMSHVATALVELNEL